MTALVLYTRPGCHLCDVVRDRLEALREDGLRFELREVNIDEDDRLLASYLERIPVVEIEGEVVSELRLDEDAVRAKIGTVSE